MKNTMLTFAREYRGMTQTSLAAKISGLSQSNLSKYEKGLCTLSDEILCRIMNTLEFPMEFLDLKIENNVECRHYRKKASINATERNKIDRFISLAAYCFDWISEYVNLPDFKFKYMDLEAGMTPEEVARQVRRMFRLGVAPVENICNFIEKNGVFIYYWDCKCDEFDGVSLITDKGNHLIIINQNMSNDRIRFSIAHELGHILMHQCCDFVVLELRDKEKEANRFASEFLMPEQAIKPALSNLTFSQLPTLKAYWLTSMAAIIQRAKFLERINDSKYKTFRIELSRRAWLKKEPYPVFVDKPTVISKIYSLVTKELGYDKSQIALLSKIPSDIINEMYDAFNKSNLTLKRHTI